MSTAFQNLTGLPARENSWFALIDLRNDCSSLDAILGVLKSARLINGTLLRGILFYVDEIPSAPSLNNLGNRSELHSAPLYALLLPREAVPLSVRRCSDTPNTTTACTVAISTSPEGTSPRSRFWIHRSPSSPPPSPSSTPSFPRHRVNASPPDHYSNQSSSDGTVGSTSGNGVSSGSGGVVNMEDAFLNRSSVLFVAVSFILLMFISLAWLVFYYVQRFRYLHSKERASRRLAELARKAVARIPLKLLQAGDKEIGANGEHCAICIEPYRPFDNIRILPCRQVIWFILYPLLFILQLVQVVPPSMAWRSLHYFHKLCIDPWLLEQRSCPMCKLDILQAYDFRPEMDRSCPASTGSDSSTSPAVASAGQTSSPVLVRGGVGTEREEGGVVTAVNTAGEEVTPETVITASISNSYHDLEQQSGESTAPSRVDWFRGLFRPPTSTPYYQRRIRRLCLRNVEITTAEVETLESQPSSHLLPVEGCDEDPPHASPATVS
ncbi:RING finger protein [Echinococcus granulosus]|uniref:Goliath e3 ubiquitin ligase n=1 Tax=Echinococcus granulosus TaxID=6210 RepID=A0A068WVY8_ECHGR|nr:RING finger protein [Echinococcus granulosus]CDS24015.1 goliath e3 ubiquitin ligase [Echinococcus granulosus]